MLCIFYIDAKMVKKVVEVDEVGIFEQLYVAVTTYHVFEMMLLAIIYTNKLFMLFYFNFIKIKILKVIQLF